MPRRPDQARRTRDGRGLLRLRRTHSRSHRAARRRRARASSWRAPGATIRVDAEIAPEMLTSKLALELATLEPCGSGNPRPYLLIRDVRVYDIRQVGADADHLRCKVTVGRFTFDAMAFRRGDHAEGMTE